MARPKPDEVPVMSTVLRVSNSFGYRLTRAQTVRTGARGSDHGKAVVAQSMGNGGYIRTRFSSRASKFSVAVVDTPRVDAAPRAREAPGERSSGVPYTECLAASSGTPAATVLRCCAAPHRGARTRMWGADVGSASDIANRTCGSQLQCEDRHVTS